MAEARDLDRAGRRLRAARARRSSRRRARCTRDGVRSEPAGTSRTRRPRAPRRAGCSCGRRARPRAPCVIGPDLAPNAAEVVEEPGSLAWELGEQRCEPQQRPPRRVYSAAGGFRSAFVRARRRLPSSRRSRAFAPGVVGTRRRGTASAARSFSTRRSIASSRFRSWLRSSWATARRTGPDARDDAPLLQRRSARSTPRRRTPPRRASTTSGRADRPARSIATPGSRSRRAAGRRSA